VSAPYGKLPGEPSDVYHHNDALGAGEINAARKSLALLRMLRNGEDSGDSKALLFGRALHCLILEPTEFDYRFAMMPEADGRTKEGKAIRDQFKANAGSKGILTHQDYQLMRRMRESIETNVEAQELLRGSEREVTFRAKDPSVELDVQCRADIWNEWDNVCADLKSCESLSSFRSKIYDYGYHRAAAHYREVIRLTLGLNDTPRFVFIAVEKSAPYAVACYELDEIWLEVGFHERRETLASIKQCIDTDVWPRDPDGVQRLEAPDFIQRKLAAVGIG